ncbi:hypothetical protein Cdeb_03346 [Caldibacillus debilis GB1]|jgi:hypothetical protein|uniref:Uncharacterized protein n=1 Tax=Caldibacillus debilis GB1 TaxID=1339248 RepID=A0A420VFJ7_9BACI|nr:hypothetical protein Cdeb_03346 [Caldibacillus debilis GB1]
MFGAMRRGWPRFWALSAGRDRCSGSAFRRPSVFKGGPSPHRERDFAGVGGTFSRERVFRFSGDAHVRALWERSFSGRNLVFSSGSNRIFWEKSSLFFRLKPSFRGKIPFPAKLKPIFYMEKISSRTGARCGGFRLSGGRFRFRSGQGVFHAFPGFQWESRKDAGEKESPPFGRF